MKKAIVLLFALTSTFLATAQVGSWAKKTSPNYDLTAREDAGMIAFNNKLYILGGYSGCGPKDFTEYDPTTGTIKKLADLGTSCANSILSGSLFAVQGKFYSFSAYGTGISTYNILTDKWAAYISGLPAGFIPDAGFVINDTIFLTSQNGNLFYSYNVVTNRFTQKADYPGNANSRHAMAFAINNKGYFGGGRTYANDGCTTQPGCFSNTFYEYNPLTNTWTTKANLPFAYNGGAGIGFNGKGYAGTGEYSYSPVAIPLLKSHFWYEYDPTLNTWTTKQSLMNVSITDSTSGFNVQMASIAIIADNIYLFGGTAGYKGSVLTDNLYKYNVTANNWQAVNMELGGNRTEASGFYANGKLYMGGGHDDESLTDFWEYDIATSTWASKEKFSSPHDRRSIVELNGKGYFIGGYGKNVLPHPTSPINRKYIDSLLEYNPATNLWTAKASFPGKKRGSLVALTYNGKIYAGMGVDTNGSWDNRDFYEYNPINDSWLAKTYAPIGGSGFSGGSNISYFVLGDTAYITRLNHPQNRFYLFKYAFLTDSWVFSPLPADVNTFNVNFNTNRGFALNGKGYLVHGDHNERNQLSEYNPASGWKKTLNIPVKITDQTIIPALNSVYFGYGYNNTYSSNGVTRSNDWYELRFNAGVSKNVGNYTQVINNSLGPVCGTGDLLGASASTIHDNAGDLFVAIFSNNTMQSSLCLEVNSVDTLMPYRSTFGNFGKGFNENGMFLNKSVLSNNSQLVVGASIRLYYTTSELTKFVNAFNLKYNSNQTIDSIKILQYFIFNNNDHNPLNNTAGGFKLFSPTLVNYGGDKYVEITSAPSGNEIGGELYAVLSSTNNATSINEPDKNSFIHLYPNPTTGIITIELNSATQTTLTLYNIAGQKLISKVSSGKISNLDLSGLSNGVYYLHLNNENKSAVNKIVLNK